MHLKMYITKIFFVNFKVYKMQSV